MDKNKLVARELKPGVLYERCPVCQGRCEVEPGVIANWPFPECPCCRGMAVVEVGVTVDQLHMMADHWSERRAAVRVRSSHEYVRDAERTIAAEGYVPEPLPNDAGGAGERGGPADNAGTHGDDGDKADPGAPVPPEVGRGETPPGPPVPNAGGPGGRNVGPGKRR